VAEADYDYRPPWCALRIEISRFFAASPTPSSPALAAFARRPGGGIQRPHIQLEWQLYNPIASAPGPHERKMQCSKPSLSVDLHQPLGNLCGAIGLFGWRQSRFRGP
jgi:hypothetical protein